MTQSICFIFYESVVITVVFQVLAYTYTRRKMFYFLSRSLENKAPNLLELMPEQFYSTNCLSDSLIITILHICEVLLVSAPAYFAEMCNLSVGDSRRPYGRDALNASPTHRHQVDSQPSEHQGRVDIYDTRQRESHSVFDQFISRSNGVGLRGFILID